MIFVKEKKVLITAAINKFDGQLFNLILKKEHLVFVVLCPKVLAAILIVIVKVFSPPVAGALGTLIANEVITSILNLKSYLNGNILIYDALKTNFRKTKLSFNPNCKNQC